MYRDIIIFKEDTPKDVLEELKEICIKAHDNRAGIVKAKQLADNHLVFEGKRNDYPCLQIAYLNLNHNELFKNNLHSWEWEDEVPYENCNLLIELDI